MRRQRWAVGGRRTGAGWSGVVLPPLSLARGAEDAQQRHNPSCHLSVSTQPARNDKAADRTNIAMIDGANSPHVTTPNKPNPPRNECCCGSAASAASISFAWRRRPRRRAPLPPVSSIQVPREPPAHQRWSLAPRSHPSAYNLPPNRPASLCCPLDSRAQSRPGCWVDCER